MFLFYFIFLWGYYGGALVFLGGAGAPASPSLAPPMPKGILGWASGAECIERAERNLQKGALRSKGNMTATLPAPLRSHALVANPMNFVSVRHKKNKWFTRRDLPCPAASSVDGITDYNGFYSILSRCTAPLESGVDTVRAMQMQVNTEFRSLPRLFVLLYLSMFVICLFFYANLLAYKIMIIDYFFFQIELFKSSGVFFFLFHIAIYIAEIQNITMWVFFQYRAALVVIIPIGIIWPKTAKTNILRVPHELTPLSAC